MRFDELKTIYAQVHQADQACRREYALSDRAAVQLTFHASARDPIPRATLSHRVYPAEACEECGGGFESLSPKELMNLAEITSMLNAWVAGLRDEMPPSTSTRIGEEDAAFVSRRRALSSHGM